MDHETLGEQVFAAFPESALIPVPEPELVAIRRQYGGIPDDYLMFLQKVSSGCVGESLLAIYRAPRNVSQVLGESRAADLERLLLVGDDFAGWLIGLDRDADWRPVWLDSATLRVHPRPVENFTEFVSAWISEQR